MFGVSGSGDKGGGGAEYDRKMSRALSSSVSESDWSTGNGPTTCPSVPAPLDQVAHFTSGKTEIRELIIIDVSTA